MTGDIKWLFFLNMKVGILSNGALLLGSLPTRILTSSGVVSKNLNELLDLSWRVKYEKGCLFCCGILSLNSIPTCEKYVLNKLAVCSLLVMSESPS